ncbi:carbohydrate ABC transporter permease [Paenibacillus sp. OV219]|uniref:carbohydrate ABC transporter permease n=1 Tax=Paenibacillus sp. OV219 TaxID=1884377 RepID=UPI0008D62D0F|nr:sugar ABC transporter permease [Paenibacillus sp. OV219]SEO67575.1 carbohydrate ABC transporter membrane protein 1, CUT1 family [Paenibacillus sp. OV219]
MAQSQKRYRLARREAIIGYCFASPWFIGLIVFVLFPVFASLRYSFMDYDILQPPKWVGFANYTALLHDNLFWRSLYNTLYYVVFSVPLTIILGLAIALLLNIEIKGIAIYRTLYYIPSIVPMVAASILWAWIFDPNFGILTNFVHLFGLSAPGWLSDPAWAKNSLILMSLWGAGSGMIIYLAGLKNIPKVYYEAADIDGAGTIQKFFHVTLPLITPTLFFQLIIGMIGSFQVFTQSYIITGGGPNDSTLFYVLYLYNNAFRFWKMGYASALAWVLFFIIMFLTWLNLKLSKRWVNYDQI